MKTTNFSDYKNMATGCRNIDGFSLVASLIILTVISTMIVAAMLVNLRQGNMSINSGEKTRALSSAQNAINYARWWMAQPKSNISPVVCASGKLATAQICKEAVNISNTSINPLATWVEYQPSTDTAYWKTNESGEKAAFYANPGFYIQYLYDSPSGSESYYKITAFGYGDTSQTVAVIQGVFETGIGGSRVKDLGKIGGN